MRLPLAGSIEHRRRAAGDAVRPILLTSWPRDLQILEHGVGNVGLDVQLVEPRRVRPERSVEMQRLDARPLERRVKVRVPFRPELDDVQECLEDGLLLVVAAGRADRHERLAVAQHDAGRQRIAGPRPRPQLRGPRLVEPELSRPARSWRCRSCRESPRSESTPPLGVLSKMLPSRSITAMWVVSLMVPRIGSASGRRLAAARRRRRCSRPSTSTP